jgi:hypothetical protein
MIGDLTVIIVNWNTKDMLRNCLSSLREELKTTNGSVIVIDNDSRDGSREMVGDLFPEMYLINSGRNAGFAAANNIGLKMCISQNILFLNPDTVVLPGSIRKMVEVMIEYPSVGAVGCKMVDESGKVLPMGLQWFPSPFTELVSLLLVSKHTLKYFRNILPYKNPEESGYVKKIFGGCFLVRKDVLDRVGYFDDRFFMYVEDVDLCRRIIEGGWKIYYLSETEIIHYCGASSNKAGNYFSVLMKYESIWKYMEKYYGKLGAGFYKLFVFVGSGIRVIFLLFFSIICLLFKIDSGFDYKNSIYKNVKMVRWSINMERAVIKT